MLLFVYGTLKSGQRNHAFLAGQTYRGPARTPPSYRLYDCGPYPALVEGAGGVSVQGELWDVDADRLEAIDRLEGVEDTLFEQRTIRLEEPPEEALAYLYVGSVEEMPDCGSTWEP